MHSREYGLSKSIEDFVDDADFMIKNQFVDGNHDLMWDIASTAPHRFAEQYDRRVLVILDEFQYISTFVYPDQNYQLSHIETMPGSFHSLSESKIAPMLITLNNTVEKKIIYRVGGVFLLPPYKKTNT